MAVSVSWENNPPKTFPSMEDLITYYLCGQCYKELKEGKWYSVRQAPCGIGLSRIKEVED